MAHPFFQWRQNPDGSRELLIGPSFGRTLVWLSIIIAMSALLVLGVVRWHEIAPHIPSWVKFLASRGV